MFLNFLNFIHKWYKRMHIISFFLWIACSGGWYGLGCKQQCLGHCLNQTSCNHVTGQCDGDCAYRWYGQNCNETCIGHCKDNATCNQETGQCEGGCAAGWNGDNCDMGKVFTTIKYYYFVYINCQNVFLLSFLFPIQIFIEKKSQIESRNVFQHVPFSRHVRFVLICVETKLERCSFLIINVPLSLLKCKKRQQKNPFWNRWNDGHLSIYQ